MTPDPFPPSDTARARVAAQATEAASEAPTSMGQPGAAAGGSASPSRGGSDPFRSAGAKQIDLTGRTIGGYKVLRMLGAGGMGAVCLAHQASLDREVALKILPAKMAANPDFLMRFTREALSAARLAHHNIVQIYDIGSHDDIHYISMEFVRGETLGQIVRERGSLDPAEAAGYVLQAARGLDYAHNRGIVHRDIKPDNLMVNEHGLVKIADMGLAKMSGKREIGQASVGDAARDEMLLKAGGDLTMSDVAMGTPAYMPPEQARDASTVDHRADQYSLGCTLFYLLAGRTPFGGSSAMEIITKHVSEPLPSLVREAPNCPETLAAIVERMTAKEPEDRFRTTAEVVGALESFLQVAQSAPRAAAPRAERDAGEGEATRVPAAVVPPSADLEGDLIAREMADYYKVPAIKTRATVLPAFVGGIPLLAILMTAIGDGDWGRGLLGILAVAPLAKFVVEGVAEKNDLFRRVRSAVLGMSPRGWGVLAGVLLVFLLLLREMVFVSLAGGVVAAFSYFMFVKTPLRRQRRAHLDRAEGILRDMRRRGWSEEAIREFVGVRRGREWEEFYEDLFGYEEMIAARERWRGADRAEKRKSRARWRDPLARRLAEIENARRKRREGRELRKIETDRLKARGVAESEARRQADANAREIMRQVSDAERAPRRPAAGAAANAPARPDAFVPVVRERTRSSGGEALQFVRFVAGLALCAAYGAAESIGLRLLPAETFPHLYDELGLAAGLMLCVSALSSRSASGLLLLLGAALLVGKNAIAGLLNMPGFDATWIMGVGVIAILVGFGVPVLGKATGGDF